MNGDEPRRPPTRAWVPDAPHGTRRGWEMGCRCGWCQAAGDQQTTDTEEGLT